MGVLDSENLERPTSDTLESRSEIEGESTKSLLDLIPLFCEFFIETFEIHFSLNIQF